MGERQQVGLMRIRLKNFKADIWGGYFQNTLLMSVYSLLDLSLV